MTGRGGKRGHPGRIRAYRTELAAGLGRDYDRQRDLPRLLPVFASDMDIGSPQAQARLVAMLRRALRGERVRARAGHWAYDPGRHAALLRALRWEQEALGRACYCCSSLRERDVRAL